MKYREGTTADYGAITTLIAGSGYFNAVYPPDLGGHWIVAEDDGRIVGCIWAFVEAPHAYIDYWYVVPEYRKGKVPARLMFAMQSALADASVRYVRCNVLAENTEAERMVRAFGVLTHNDYLLGYKELPDGRSA